VVVGRYNASKRLEIKLYKCKSSDILEKESALLPCKERYMWEVFWLYWWLAGAGILLFVWPVLVVGHLAMIVIDHRRYRDWRSTGLAILWPFLCVPMVGVLQGNLSPPLFGIPIALLFVLVWMRDKNLFIVGVASYYCLSALVVLFAVIGKTETNWLFVVFWPLSLVSLILWRRERVSAIRRVAQAKGSPTCEHSEVR
jgi:hypothetical protein